MFVNRCVCTSECADVPNDAHMSTSLFTQLSVRRCLHRYMCIGDCKGVHAGVYTGKCVLVCAHRNVNFASTR